MRERPPLRLVLVDNDCDVLELLSLDMRLEGHEVVAVAETGDEALRACAQEDPDVLIADFRLGRGIDGLEVARRAALLGPRVVLHTNYVSKKIVDAATEAGAIVVEKGSLGALRRAVRG